MLQLGKRVRVKDTVKATKWESSMKVREQESERATEQESVRTRVMECDSKTR
jgi:hypothetical protein